MQNKKIITAIVIIVAVVAALFIFNTSNTVSAPAPEGDALNVSR